MEYLIFEGSLRMGDSKDATMVFAQDFEVSQRATGERELLIACEGVEILGRDEQLEAAAHPVHLDHTVVGRIRADDTRFKTLPVLGAGPHRVRIDVSPFHGHGFCDDFVLRRVVLKCA